MKLRITGILMIGFFLFCTAASAETRTYRQVKDVSVQESGKVNQSGNKGDLFECTYSINYKKNTITRVKIQRLDDKTARDDATVYSIIEKRNLLGSRAGNGGKVLIAVQKNGTEILELGNRFAFTMRPSPFSQVITGVYKRVYEKDIDKKLHKHKI